jgi:hypothetical protein
MRKFKIRIGAEPLNEIQEIINWYNDRKVGLGASFDRRIKLEIKRLKTNALFFEKRYGNMRCARVGKFPYLIHFEVIENENAINITSIKHTSRNPNLWLEPEIG